MEPSDFVYLHVHSHYSLLEALPKVKGIVARAKALGMRAVALTDNGNLYGAVEFFKACKEAEIQPILGCDLYIAPYGMTDKRARVDERSHRLVVLVQNDEGYRNLCAIVTAGFLEGFYYKPRVDKAYLRAHAGGLLAFSGAISGEIPAALLNGDQERARAALAEYQAIFGCENFFLELIHHPDFPRQEEANSALRALAEESGAPLLVTRNVFYLDPEQREGYDASSCIQRGRTLEEYRRTATEEIDLSFGTPQELCAAFADLPEALANTRRIADRVTFQLELGKNYLPHYALPEGKTVEGELRDLCEAGLRFRYGDPMPVHVLERFEFEYATIVKMGFPSYFLIVQDYITWAKRNGVLVGPGRGSAAGSIIAYALQITDIDPLMYGLLFERFLNPDRVSIPDIDTDFADRGRSKVLEYVTARYGADRVAGIITFGTLMPRAAVRDAARVLGLSFQEGDRIAKVVPPPVQGKHIPLQKAVVEIPDLKAMYESDPIARRVVDLAMQLEGNPRHASQHACGIVIGDRPLVERAPLQAGQHEDMALITQYSLNSAEAAGLVKMDFLGLSNLTVIEDALEIIRAVHGDTVDINTIPLNDPTTFALLGRGETTGVFQLESDGMKRYIRDLQPSAFEDIIAMVSLYRPGPMQFIDQFIRRKHGQEPVVYEHPLMENAFRETYGIPVYQEQVMQVSKDLAGFTGGEADTLRKAMGKKIAELMAKMKVKFVDGAVRNGVKESIATAIFQKLEDFAAYGFNKSHAACYALIAYRTAYLKAHYPACFMAALMNSDAGNIDRITIEVEECGRLGLTVLPPDVNESFAGFAVVKGTSNIRWGLMAIKNVGAEIAEEMVRERKRGGEFADLADLLARIRSHAFNKKTLEALAKSGALDRFASRAQLVENLDALVMYNRQVQQEKDRNQSSLFELAGDMGTRSLELRPAAALSTSSVLLWEKELLGLYVSTHPAKLFFDAFGGAVTGASVIAGMDNSTPVSVCGVVAAVKQIFTKKGNEPMAFVRCEDPTGTYEVVVFPKVYLRTRQFWNTDVYVLVRGKIAVRSRDDAEGGAREERSVLADDVRVFTEQEIPAVAASLRMGAFAPSSAETPLPPVAAPAPVRPEHFAIVLPTQPPMELVARLREALKASPGATRVVIEVGDGASTRRIATEYCITPTRELAAAIRGIAGEGSVKY